MRRNYLGFSSTNFRLFILLLSNLIISMDLTPTPPIVLTAANLNPPHSWFSLKYNYDWSWKVICIFSIYCSRLLSFYGIFCFQANRGLGLTAHIIDHCNVILKFPQGTNSTWVCLSSISFLLFTDLQSTQMHSFFHLQYNEQFKIFEPLEYKYDVCEAILLWEQVPHTC